LLLLSNIVYRTAGVLYELVVKSFHSSRWSSKKNLARDENKLIYFVHMSDSYETTP